MTVNINKNPPWFRTASQCRYSNLPVSHPEMFISRHPGTNYFVEIAKLGDQIVLVKGSGNVRSYEMEDALCFMDEYVSRYLDIHTGVFLIENYADIGRVDFKARKIYIDHHKNSDVFWGGIFYSMPRLMRFSFKVAQRLHIQDNDVYAVASYKQAISLAQEIISRRETGHVSQHDKGSGFQSLPGRRPRSAEIISSRTSGAFNKFKNKFFRRNNEKVIREYSEILLKYIESIDWQKDGFEAPEIIYPAGESARKVFYALSYIKSEVDDLLNEKDTSEKVLRKSEARFRELVKHAKAGIMEFDYQTNRIVSVNDSLLDISGYTREEVLSMNPMDLMTEESKKIYARRFAQRLAGEIISPDSIYQFLSKSGQKKWVQLNTNVNYKDGQIFKADVVVTDITRLKAVESELVRYQSKLKKLAIELSKSEESQKRHLASRLHESVSQELFAAQLKLNALEKSLDDPKYFRRLEEIKEQIVKSIKDIRNITYDLSPPVLYDLGLKEAVESLVKSIESKYRFPVKARFSGPLENINDEIKIITYRVIREIVQNSIKHARASFADIIINNKNNVLSIDVTDNGVGFDTDIISEGHHINDGFGLFDIKEKINHLGGHLTIYSTPGSGTRICLSIPLNGISSSALKN